MRASKSRSWPSTHSLLVWSAAIVLVLVILVVAAVALRAPGSDNNAVPSEGQVSLEGNLTCLPHKDTNGPQTLECAIGLKSGEEYYGLKTETPGGPQLMSIPFDETVTVSGELQYESSDLYQMSGTITVTNISQEQ